MKAKWTLALMCAVTLTFVSCGQREEPNPPTPPDTQYVQPILTTDHSLADWDSLDASKVTIYTCPADAAYKGLKSAKIYADKFFIFAVIEPNLDVVTDRSSAPFHVYLNTDNSDKTGGYGGDEDNFSDPNCDILLEGPIFSNGAACTYKPAVFKWWGAVGDSGWDDWMEPGVEHSSADNWGAIVALGALTGTRSQFVDNKFFEIQIRRDKIPTDAGWNEDAFGIGFDIQQNWETVGVIPLVSPTEENPVGVTTKLTIQIDK